MVSTTLRTIRLLEPGHLGAERNGLTSPCDHTWGQTASATRAGTRKDLDEVVPESGGY